MRLLRPVSVLVSVAVVTVLALLSAAAPPRMLVFGMLALGPALAATSSNPSAVLLVGGYALATAFTISTWQGLLGTLDQFLRLVVVVTITVISWAVARHHRALARGQAGAAREREMLVAFAEQSADAIIVSRLDGVVTSWNGGAERLYGYTADEVIGSRFAKVIPPERRHALDQALAELADGRQIRLDETRRICRDGSERVVSVTVSPIRDELGNVVAAAATERDITDQKLAAERSARAARLESLGQLAGGVAHDFNNLLAIILNYADFLADEITPDGADDLARIRDAADRARSLTGQLLLFAKREPTEVEIVDLNDSITCSGELLSRSIGANIRMVCRTHSHPLPVRANRGRLDQILLNLVINARDAMPDGGVVVIETSRAGAQARLTVSDTGTGMTPEVRDRLFEPFFTTKPADRGTGLGLATVYGIVGDAGGTIGVDSTLGIGTTFEILLPLVSEPATAPAECLETGPAHGHGERIAVIEDEDYVRDLVIRILREHGYRTTALSEENLAASTLDDASLLITDIVLRGRPGPALADDLRDRHPGLRVLFMSGYSDAELRRRYDIGDATRIVQKPFTAVELLAAVDEALSTPPAVGSAPGSSAQPGPSP
ncbi:PAS domain S-box protein [Actinoplanes sp. NPDC051861]|uniref:hybrid sensor histidine kinase/response regulator n=1 Tax=Actinoplanes sp. NPDC051861 TaxID=3155170 RepID=UPI0034161EDA